MKKANTITFITAMALSMNAMAQNSHFTFSGKVLTAKGSPVAGVVVNNGYDFVQTDKEGRWQLQTDTCLSKFVSISIPADYELPSKNSIATGFYTRVDELTRSGNKHDFRLTPRKAKTDRFTYISISDPQMRTDKHYERWMAESVPELMRVCDSIAKNNEVVSVSLGDLVWDNMPMFDKYETSYSGIKGTFFQCIGNHDFDLRYQGLQNMPYGTPVYAEMQYQRHFGPCDYSFNIGKVHFITMQSINYYGGRTYREALTQTQLNWLTKDLSYVPKGSLVFVNMHAACWNAVSNTGNVANAKALKEILKDYNVHTFAGHTHFFQNNIVDDNLYEHNIGAVCGGWWTGEVNRCGAPNGFLLVDVDGTNVRWHYKATKQSQAVQMKLYSTGEFSNQKDYVVANIWDWDKLSTVEYMEDGVRKGSMEQFTDEDEAWHSQDLKADRSLCLTSHLFRAKPSPGTKELTVIFHNQFGEEYMHTVSVK